ncbi:uncharacterized protein LOC144431963 isoform X2 [Styela clava]
MANVDLSTYRIRIGLFRGGCRTKENRVPTSTLQLSDYSTGLSLAILTLVFALLAVHGIEKNPGPRSSDQNDVNEASSVDPEASAITELDDAFYETIDKFSLQQFKIFAQSKNGLVLSYREVCDITDHSTELVDDQKYAVLSLWKEKNGKNGTAGRIREVVNNFIGLEASKDAIQDFEPGARFEDVFLDLPRRFLNIADFKRFALSKNGLCLSLNDVTSIEDDLKYSLDQMLSMLWLWKENAGNSALTTVVMEIIENYKVNQHRHSGVKDERIEDAFLEIIETIHNLSEFREFARSSNGLSLNSVDVTMIEQDSKSIFDKKLSMLRLWKQNSDILVTAATIRDLVEKYGNVTPQTTYQGEQSVPQQSLQTEEKSSNQGHMFETSAEKKFVDKVNDSTRKIIEYDVRSVFKELNELEEEVHPKLAVANFKNQTSSKALGQSNAIGIDKIGISLDQLHDDLKGTTSNHIMLLGDAGSGKTISAKKYAKTVLDKGSNVLKDILMTFYISVSDLQHETKSTPFDLLFTQQIRLPNELKKAGGQWIERNADKILLVIDGLDRASELFGGLYPKIPDSNINLKTNTILANILSGSLYPGMKILSTSRWSTFWKLDPKQKPWKVVVLEGFDDNDIPKILSNLVVSNAKEEALQNEITQSPKIISLCKNPMFLIYMAKVLKQTGTKIPETESETIVTVLKFFSGSDHFNADLQKLMKLAFSGIKENTYSFSASHAENLGFDVSELRGLITIKAEPEPYQSRIVKTDLSFEFLHQTMQELLAAFELFNFKKEHFIEFISVELNKPHWQATRKYLYGIVLNPITRKLAGKFVKGKNMGLLQCIQSLESQLESFHSSGTISNMEHVSLLHECGPGVISKFKYFIKQFEISRDTAFVKPLRPGEDYVLAYVSNMCLPLEFISLNTIELNSNILQLMYESSKSVNVIKVKQFIVGKSVDLDDYNKIEHLFQVLDIEFAVHLKCDEILVLKLLNSSDPKMKEALNKLVIGREYSEDVFRNLAEQPKYELLKFHSSNLTKQKLRKLKESFIGRVEKVRDLWFEKEEMLETEGYRDVAQLISNAKTVNLFFEHCNLTDKKIDLFAQGAADYGVKLDQLVIKDEININSEAYHTLGIALVNSKTKFFQILDCYLTKKKIYFLNNSLESCKYKLAQLYVKDKTLESKEYFKVAELASTTKLELFNFVDSNLNFDKLDSFAKGALENQLQLGAFGIVEEKSMEPELFIKFAQVASITYSESLHIRHCNLTNGKLDLFLEGASEYELKINTLYLEDNTMEPGAFHKFAQVASIVEAKLLQFVVCNLTIEKLNAFAQGVTDFGLKIDELILSDKTMKGEAFHKFAEVVSITNAEQVSFINCSLTSEKLKVFRQGAADRGLKINTLYVADKTMEHDEFHKFAHLASTVEARKVHLDVCNLTSVKLNAFAEGATDFSLKIDELTLSDKTMKCEAFHKFAEVSSITNAGLVLFFNCSLTSEKLKVFRQRAADRGLKINFLYLADKIMEPKAFHEFAQVASTVEAGKVQFDVCNLTSEKLNAFAQGATDFGLKIGEITLSDKTMKCEAFHKFAEVASITNAGQVSFFDCSLTSEKLKIFKQGAADRELKINFLYLADKIMEPKAFHEFAQVASTVEAGKVQFDVCNLTSEKLNAFAQGATDFGLKFDRLTLSDKTMKGEAFRKFTEVASITNAGQVSFINCSLTSEKLKVFRQGAADRGLRINFLYLADKIMEPKAFHEFAQVASTVEAGKVQFDVCNLTSEKLNAFAQGATDVSLKIDDLIVSDETMKCEAFNEFAEVASITKAGEVSFLQCSLTSEKLKVFRQRAADRGLKTNTLYLADKIMEPMAFHEFAQVASTVEAEKVQFDYCNLTSEKLNAFAQGATDFSLKIRRLILKEEPKPSQNTAKNLFQMFSNVEGRLFRDGWEIDESNNELIIRSKDSCQSATVRSSRIQRIKKSINDIFRRRNRE